MKSFLTTFLFLMITLCAFSQKSLTSPDDFFQEKMGEHFYPHHLIVDYFEEAAASSEQVKLVEYGRTNQKRPLVLAFISSKEKYGT